MLMQIDRSLNVVMLSCSNEVGTVVEAIRLGAQDYLTKPFEKAELDVAMLKCRQKQQLRAENKSLREYCDAITEDICFLAASPQMVRIRQQILQIAPVDVPVFIYGESGCQANCSNPNCLDSNKALSPAPFVRNPGNLNSPTRAPSSSTKLRR